MLSACAGGETGYSGITYPETDKVVPVFQKSRVPDSCRVFAQLFATMPAGYSGADFVAAVSQEARSKGAEMMYIGQSRQCTTETSLTYTYYGPEQEYPIRDWPGWNYGSSQWQEQGEWCSIGYLEWGDSEVRFDYPVVMQVAFLRCRQDS
jgi:hypothetical protein